MRARQILAVVLAGVLGVVAGGGCRRVTPLPPTALSDVASLDEFRATFNAERDRARLLVLLAPT